MKCFFETYDILIPCQIENNQIYCPSLFIEKICKKIFHFFTTSIENEHWLLIENQQTVLSFKSEWINDMFYWNITTISRELNISFTYKLYNGWVHPTLFTISANMNKFLQIRDTNVEKYKRFGIKTKVYFYIRKKKDYFYHVHLELLYKPLIGIEYFRTLEHYLQISS